MRRKCRGNRGHGLSIPVVATRRGGPDGVITDGVDGFLVPTGDAEVMARRPVLLYNNPGLNRAIGRSARLMVESRYSEDVASEAFHEVYRALLSAREFVASR